MPKLKIYRMPYKEALLQKWKKKDYEMLESSQASDYLKQILKEKMDKRSGTRRFFGEAYVASKIPHRYGYYGSFKWLTNPTFANDREFPEGPAKKFQEKFREALREHFTKTQLGKLQRKANGVKRLNGKKPVPPDLWLLDAQGNHHFIEVKLRGDKIKRHQLAGPALIASCLSDRKGISVEIIDLVPEGDNISRPPGDEKKIFMHFCRALGSR